MEAVRRASLGQRLFVFALALVFVYVSIQYIVKVSKSKSAINRWAPQIQQIEVGEDINRQYNYPNPPIMALILWPFSELITHSPIAGALVWFYLKLGMAVFCLGAVFRLVESADRPFPPWAKALTVVLSIRPILGDLSHGNVNIFILFLVVGSLIAFSRGRDLIAGTLLALAIACKVTPALFVAYFVWKRAWKVLAGTAIGLVAFFLIIPSLVLGWELNWRSLMSWIDVMILPFVTGGFVTPEHNNQSLPGLIARLLTVAPSYSTYIGGEYFPMRYDNIADIGPHAAGLLVKGFMALFALMVIWTCRAPIAEPGRPVRDVRRGWRLTAEYSLICLGMLLFSERTWKHHCVTLLLPFAVLCYGLAGVEWSKRQRRFFLGVMAGAIVLMTTTSTGIFNERFNKVADQVETASVVLGPAGLAAATQGGLFTDSIAKEAQLYGAYVWAFLLLIAGLTVQLRTCAPASASPVERRFKSRARFALPFGSRRNRTF
jgi:hypothetical protein